MAAAAAAAARENGWKKSYERRGRRQEALSPPVSFCNTLDVQVRFGAGFGGSAGFGGTPAVSLRTVARGREGGRRGLKTKLFCSERLRTGGGCGGRLGCLL